MLDEAAATAELLGMRKIIEQVDELRARGPSPPPVENGANALRHEGEYWSVRFADQTSRVRARAGLAYLAVLLERPHREVPALVLAAAAGGESREAVERVRVRVTRALRDAIARIGAVDAALGDHLAHSVRTGRSCCYAPPEPTRWTVIS